MYTGISAEDSAVAEAKPKWMITVNAPTKMMVASSGMESSPIAPKVFCDSQPAAPVFSSSVPSEMPTAKTTSVPQLMRFSAFFHVNTPTRGSSRKPIATRVIVEESTGWRKPSVDQKNSSAMETTINRISGPVMGPISSS